MITERLVPNLRVLFIGFNPSPASFETGFNYAGRNNRFYRVLFESGLTAEAWTPSQSPGLLDTYRYGFTNLVSRPTRLASEVTRQEYRLGSIELRSKLEQYRPQVACYVGKGVYAEFTSRRQRVPWGFQDSEQVSGVRDFVAPGTSGLVRMSLEEQVTIYRALALSLSDAALNPSNPITRRGH